MAGPTGRRAFEDISRIEIAEHDSCFGNAYIGHELRIDDQVIGYVRLGSGVEYDGDALQYLNGLFNQFAKAGILDQQVGEYLWQ